MDYNEWSIARGEKKSQEKRKVRSASPQSLLLRVIQAALEQEGIVFIQEEVFEGVKLRKSGY